jgi:hypothetical protein
MLAGNSRNKSPLTFSYPCYTLENDGSLRAMRIETLDDILLKPWKQPFLRSLPKTLVSTKKSAMKLYDLLFDQATTAKHEKAYVKMNLRAFFPRFDPQISLKESTFLTVPEYMTLF